MYLLGDIWDSVTQLLLHLESGSLKQRTLLPRRPPEMESNKLTVKTIKSFDHEEKACHPLLFSKGEHVYPPIPLMENTTYTLELKD